MTVINSELYNASRAYISAALRLLKERCGDVSKLPREESEEWNNVQGSFYRQRGSKPNWAACIRMVKDEMHALPEYGAVIEQLNTDSVAARHLDALVGSPSTGSSRVEASRLADSFIWRSLNRLGDYEFSEEAFRRRFAPFSMVWHARAL